MDRPSYHQLSQCCCRCAVERGRAIAVPRRARALPPSIRCPGSRRSVVREQVDLVIKRRRPLATKKCHWVPSSFIPASIQWSASNEVGRWSFVRYTLVLFCQYFERYYTRTPAPRLLSVDTDPVDVRGQTEIRHFDAEVGLETGGFVQDVDAATGWGMKKLVVIWGG